MGDLLPFAYPEMLKASFPEMFKNMSMANVQVNLRRVNEEPMDVYGKIAALIRDEHRHSVSFQVGSMLFTRTERTRQKFGSSETRLDLARSVVAVPSGWVLHIELDLYIKTGNSSDVNILNAILDLGKITRHCIGVNGKEVEVEVSASWCRKVRNEDIGKQLSPPVEVKMVSGKYLTIVYTIGDELSFIEFIMVLRRILADHPDREDILDKHPKLLNISSTGDHPVLAKQRGRQPERWLHIKLQVERKEAASWTTLIMRDDNLYVCGFMNEQGVYGLVDNEKSEQMFPNRYCDKDVQRLEWTVHYKSILGASSQKEVINKLDSAHLGKTFAEHAVEMLSRYSKAVADCKENGARSALAGLIVMICESARMNPIHDSMVAGWSNGTGFTKQLMRYVWGYYGKKSEELRAWKSGGYVQTSQVPHPIEELQAICLVLNFSPYKVKNEEKSNHQHGKHGNPGNNGDSSANKPDSTGRSGGGHRREIRGGRNNASGGGSSRKRDYTNNNGSSDDLQRQRKMAGNTGSGGGPASKSEDASDAASSGGRDRNSEQASDADSGGSPDNQPEESGDAGSPGGSEDTGDSSSSEGNSSGQPGEADDDAQCLGRPRVELLSMRANLGVIGTKIIVFDGIRGQIIYTKEEQGEQGRMADLVLTGPYKGISAYGGFAISIDIPAGSSTGDSGGPIQWEWDCYDPEYAKEVDKPPVRHTVGDVAEVTYAVMSNARDATVQQVRLRLKDWHSHGGISGEITALIDGFKDEHKSVLFRSAKGKGQRSKDNSWFPLELARNVVAVPCGRMLHIEVDLQIESDDSKKVEVKVTLSFENGICSSKTDDGNKVEVEVTWYPEIARPSNPPEQITIKEPDEEKFITAPSQQSGPVEVKMVSGHLTVLYTIGDELSFTEFMVALRRILTDHPDREDILDGHPKFSILSSTGEHPVLSKQRAEQPVRWIHVKLQAVKGEEISSTTLIMRDDNLYVCGFMNQQGDSFELSENLDRSANILPVDEYNPQRLSWGISYRSLLDADTGYDAARILVQARVWHDFVMDAVHVLSHFPAWVHGFNPRMALAGLTFIVCDSARMNPIHNFIARQWSKNMHIYDNVIYDVFHYERTSCELLTWKSKGYANPCPISQLQDIYLVLNYRLDHPPHKASSIGCGRPRVELLAMRADLGVDGTTIIVFDGKRGQIIYRKELEEEKGIMVDLVLTGPRTSISAYGCFAIKIDIPAEAAGSSKGDAGGSIKWEWDCYDPEYAEEVDKPPVSRTISSSGPGRNVEVIYAVMSNALEATVQVKMRCLDANSSCSVHGNITACIGDFKDRIVLFRRTYVTAQRLSPTGSRVLQLSRSVVAVPCGWVLHIEVDLQMETYSNNRGAKPWHFNIVLDFANGISSQRHKVDGNEVELNVTWYPDVSPQINSPLMENKIRPWRPQPDISYIVEDGEGFSTFITELRRLVADHPHCKDVLEDHPDPVRSSTRNHPVLPNAVRGSRISWRLRTKHDRWVLRIKLHAGLDVQTPSITLLMRVDTLDIIGFMNQNGDWYNISKLVLPREYRSTVLDWGDNYKSILGVRSWKEIMPILNSKSLGKTFAADAVSVLSRFGLTKSPLSAALAPTLEPHQTPPHREALSAAKSQSQNPFPVRTRDRKRGLCLEGSGSSSGVGAEEPSQKRPKVVAGGDNPKLALVGLMVMICESARINPVHDAIVHSWKSGTGLSEKLMGYIEKWPEMSRALLEWKDCVYEGWPRNLQLQNIGIESPDNALDKVHLVRNDPERLKTTLVRNDAENE